MPGVPQVAGSIKCLFHMRLMTPGTWGRVRLKSLRGYLARNTRIHTQNKDDTEDKFWWQMLFSFLCRPWQQLSSFVA